MLVCIDKNARIRDFYYPYVGQENHVASNMHRIGVWVEGNFSWVSKDDWHLEMSYKKDVLVSETKAVNEKLGVELIINETVHCEKDIFLREVRVINRAKHSREIKVFFNQHFQISENNIGDTVYYDPNSNAIVTFKGRRYFLIGGEVDGKKFDEFAVGEAEVAGKSGTHVDAEDGVLSGNSVEHGSVDSVIGLKVVLGTDEEKKIDYWIAVGKRYQEVISLQKHLGRRGVGNLIGDVEKYWLKWLERGRDSVSRLPERVQDLFFRSLLIVRAQTDSAGAIIAANDTHTYRYKNDTYSYMWPRDGALIARSLDRTGHKEMTERFFMFCKEALTSKGYLLHKYRPDGSLGSSWHPWYRNGKTQLPIQEDETALVLDALWKHYESHKNKSFIEGIYKNFIKRAGDFLCSFRDSKTKLPNESYDLWEEKMGVHTFTACTVYAGLLSVSKFAKVFGTEEDCKKYEGAAIEVKDAIENYLYDSDKGIFVKGIYFDSSGEMKVDYTVDCSTGYALFEYGVFSSDDERVERTMNLIKEKLWNDKIGGFARYEDDSYYCSTDDCQNVWFIPTFWYAEYLIEKSKSIEDLEDVMKIFEWATKHALSTGVLSEQINPVTGEHLSVAPLTWSHAGYIIAVIKYVERLRYFEGV